MNRIFYPIFVVLCLFLTPNLFAQDDTDCAPFLEQPDTTGDDACGFFDGAGRWINLCSPCGNKIADDDCVNAPTPSICELDGFSSTSSGFTIDLGPEGIGWCSNGAPFTVFNNNMWIGFTASTNVIDLFIDVDCPPGSLGFQLGIVSAPNCSSVIPIVCLNGGGNGSGVTNDQTLRTDNLEPGQPYFIVIDGFAGGVCDFTINVTDGFVQPGFTTAASDPSTLCLDVLNEPDFLPISPSAASGAIVDVTVDLSSGASTDLIFFWNDPNGNLIQETGPSDIFGNIVRGTLDGSFFTAPGIYSVQIVDLGSCCPICAEVELEVGMPPPAAAAAVEASTVTGVAELNCFNESLLLTGGPDSGSEIPVAEAWTIENAAGTRVTLESVLVSAQGRLDEITIDRDDIEVHFPGQEQGVARILYGFALSFEQPCFGEAFVEIPFDFREPDIDIDNPDDLDCALNPSVMLDASDTNTFGHNASFAWEAADGVSSIAGADTDMPTVTNNGIYNVTVTDLENGCTAQGSVEVMGMVDPPVLGMIDDITLNCNTMSADVSTTGTATNPIDYSWMGPNGMLPDTDPELTGVMDGGTYTLTAVNSVNQCQDSTSFNVTVEMPTINVSEVRDSTLSCIVSELTFPGAIPSGGMGPYTYSWTLNNTEVSTDSVLVADAEGDYILTVTDVGTGCTAEQTTIVNMNMESPILGMLPDTLVIDCNNPMVSAIADATDTGGGPIAGVTYEWTEASGPFSETTPDVEFDAIGTYTVEVTNPANGCVSQASIEVIEDMEDPDASIMMPADLTCDSPTTMLQGASTTTDALSYQWFAGDEMTGTALGTSIDQEVMAAGTYTLVITNDDNGCSMIANTTVVENMMDPIPDAGMDQVLNCRNEVAGVMLDGSASAANGMGMLTYAWTGPSGPAGTTAMISATEVGSYTLIVTDASNGCSEMTTVEVTPDFAAPENVSVNNEILPCGVDEVELIASTTTTGNLSYSWTDQGMNTFPSTQSIMVTTAGEFTVIITNEDNGCTEMATGTVTLDTDRPDITATLISGSLNINCDNPVLTYEGILNTPDPNVTIEWFDPTGMLIPTGSTLVLGENSMPGQYTVISTNPLNGCDAMGTITPAFDFTQPQIEFTTGTIFCAPFDEVMLTANDPSATGTSFEWTDPTGMVLGVSNPTVSTPGMYEVVATSGISGCTSMMEVLVEEDTDAPDIGVGMDFELTCMPGGDSYALGGSGADANGSDPVSFSWELNNMEISTDPNFVVTDQGIYTLTVTNMVNNCTSTETVEVTEGRTMPIAIAQVQTQLSCNTDMVMLEGSSDDMITTDYVWTNQATGTTVMGQNPMVGEPGIWELVVTSANGCTAMDMTEVLADFDPPANVEIMGANELTCNVNNIQLFGSTMTMGVTYAWTLNGDMNTVISDQQNPNFGAPGMYTLTVTGSNGCTNSADFEITSDDNLPTAMATVERELTCTNPTTMIFGTSSAPNTEYSWVGPPGFTPATTQDVVATAAGEYTLTVVDLDNMCDAMFTTTVFDIREDPVVMTTDGTVVCDPNVVTTLGVTTDVTNAEFLWSGPIGFSSMEANPVITEAGVYTVIVTNMDNGCTTEMDAEGIDGRDLPDGLQEGADVELLTCNEPVSVLSASSTTSGVIFTWNGPGVINEESSAITVDEPGTYMVTYLDPSNGCNTTRTVDIAIDTTAPMVVGATPDELNCQITDVALSVQVNEDVTYAWDGPAAVSDPTAASPTASETGLYSVTVTAADNGCTSVETIFVDIDDTMPEALASGSEITCANPTVDLLGTGSTESAMGNIRYEWTNSAGMVISTDLNTTTSVADDYTLTVFNSDNLCDDSQMVTITEDMLAPTADAGMDGVFACADDFVTLSASGSSGQGNLSYEWTNSAGIVIGNTETIDVMESGDFMVMVTDSDNGCSAVDMVSLQADANAPIIDILMPETLTCSVTSVQLNASNTTGIGNLMYAWTNAAGVEVGMDPILDVTVEGMYTLTVTDDSNGCSEMTSRTVDFDRTEPSFNASGGEIDCASGQTDVTLTNIVASNPSFSWTGPMGFTPATTQDLIGVTLQGTYEVTVTDGLNGCTMVGSAIVILNSDAPTASIDSPEILDCDTEQVQLNAQSLGSNLSFSWSTMDGVIVSGGNTLTPTVSAAGVYFLTVLDSDNGCSSTESVMVMEDTNFITDIDPIGQDVNCFGPNTGSISIGPSQVTGGTAPYMYSTDGGDSFFSSEDFLGLTAGTYEVVVMDINGCLFEQQLVIDPAEDLVLDYGENIVLAFGDSIDLVPTQINFDIAEAVWSDTLLMGPTPNVRPTSTTTYEIDAFDENGCPVSDQVTIFVEKTRPVYIPSGFSPNGDGTNDFFTVYADLELITRIRNFSVYDRWGEQMFFKSEMTPEEALQLENGWQGNFRGEEMNPGVYVYHVLVEFIDGEEIFYEGDITLVR